MPIKEATTPIITKAILEKGTPTDPIPIDKTPEEREAAAAERARLQPVLRRSAATRIGIFTNKEKQKMLEPISTEVKTAKELQELAAISALVKPNWHWMS